jgi:hypothetical protein
MPFDDHGLPALSDQVVPPTVLGTADLTGFAYAGNGQDALMERIDRFHAQDEAGRLYDRAIVCQLGFGRAEGLELQDAALDRSPLFRLRGSGAANPLRVLALAAPGDLMVNIPLDFLTNPLDVRLDLLYIRPGRPLPRTIPDHDVAFFAISEADASLRARLNVLFPIWPRPALNNPAFLPALARDTLARSLAGVPGIRAPEAVAVTREALLGHIATGVPIDGFPGGRLPYPCLIRPASSHAGTGLVRAATPVELLEHLRFTTARDLFATAFEEYAGADGLYRKYRIAFIGRRPYLCHMAVSQRWMVHYLNAGMTESAEKRAEEARAMAEFDTGFAARHASAFAALHERLGFDYYQIDCAETRDGRLLVFEADVASIVHLMDPPDLFPYKPPQMRRIFSAFGDMLRRGATHPIRS